MNQAQAMMQQGQASAAGVAQSNALAELSQGLLKNYTEFLSELGQSSMAAMAQGSADVMRQAQQAGAQVIDATHERSRRAR